MGCSLLEASSRDALTDRARLIVSASKLWIPVLRVAQIAAKLRNNRTPAMVEALYAMNRVGHLSRTPATPSHKPSM